MVSSQFFFALFNPFSIHSPKGTVHHPLSSELTQILTGEKKKFRFKYVEKIKTFTRTQTDRPSPTLSLLLTRAMSFTMGTSCVKTDLEGQVLKIENRK